MIVYQRNRVYSLIVGKGNDVVEINNLQIKFDVTKTSSNKDKKNLAEVKIYNLSEERRRKLEEDYIQVVFSVGYDDTPLVTLFSGQITNIATKKLPTSLSKRSGTDIITTLVLDELHKELNGNALSGIVPAGKTIKDVIQFAIKDTPEITRQEIGGEMSKLQVPNGYPVSGTTRQILDKLSKDYGIAWNIDNGVLYVSDYDGTYSEDKSSVISFGQFSGLIERPEYINEEAKRVKRQVDNKTAKPQVKKNSVRFKVLLSPTVVAGSIVHLDFKPFTGYYKVDEVKHEGGYRDNDWYSTLTCTEKVG